MFFSLKGDNFNGNIYANSALQNGCKYAIVDEAQFNTSSQTILVDNVLETLQKLAAFHRTYLKTPIIALTGSNGKTTTKELIHAVLSQKFNTSATIGNLNNHIGVPLTLLSMTKETEIGIVEMGANHQKEIEFLCNIATPDFGYITNFGKAHLEGFGGIEGVIKGKSEMYDHLIKHNKTVFVNGNDNIQVKKTNTTKRITFGGLNNDIHIDFIEAKPFVSCRFNNLTLKSQMIGDYNFNNIAAAIAIGLHFNVDDDSIKQGIEQYTPTNNRSQIITKSTNNIILDAYNANPSSMQAALRNFEKQKGHKTAILGDMFELGIEAKKEHQNIVDLALSLNIDTLIFIGENFFISKITGKQAKQYKTFSEFELNYDFSELKNMTMLIKGSRGMSLERILKAF